MQNATTIKSSTKKLRQMVISVFDGMAKGLFASMIIGIIIEQIGGLFDTASKIGLTFMLIGTVAIILTGGAIGAGVARAFACSDLVVFSSIVTGFIGARYLFFYDYSLENIFKGSGNPLGAVVAVGGGILASKLIAGKTKMDIVLVPLITIVGGTLTIFLFHPFIHLIITFLSNLINSAVNFQPFFMGGVVALLIGFCLTSPLSSAALSIMLSLSGLPAGAATVGCCCHMIGFAAISFKDNGISGLIAQGIGTSKIQVGNVVKNPFIIIPSLLSSFLLGGVSAAVFGLENNSVGAGMGNAGFIGPLMMMRTMADKGDRAIFPILLMLFVLPAILTSFFAVILFKLGKIKVGDMKLPK